MMLLKNYLSRFVNQGSLETSMKGRDFIFDLVQLMYFKCHKVNCKRGGSYIDFPNWIKRKNEEDTCFQNARKFEVKMLR